MPYLGDIRHNYPPGTPWRDIAVFDIWDGERWVDAQEANRRVDLVEDRDSGQDQPPHGEPPRAP